LKKCVKAKTARFYMERITLKPALEEPPFLKKIKIKT
jgi:hypothetical protein